LDFGYNEAMKKQVILSFAVILTLFVVWSVAGKWFLSLPLFPHTIRNNFQLNANILPASDDSRSLFLAINPNFRAEFGDRDNPTNAFLRFEVTNSDNNAPSSSASNDINRNLLDSFTSTYQLLQQYHPGVEWQLFSVGIDETQAFSIPELTQDNEEIKRLSQEFLGNSLIATTESDIAQVLSEKDKISTTTTVSRYQGYDAVENLAVAPATDLRYTVIAGEGVKYSIIIGDRRDFDTACLKFLSATGSSLGCDLPNNRFSFLLKLDPSQKLIHSPLSIDGGVNGTHYIVDDQGEFVLRLGNLTLQDAGGATSHAVSFEIKAGQVDNQEVDNYYVVTIIADLNWLIDHKRVFPVNLDGGFFTHESQFFQNETWQP
jgi:hypothetical protein